MYCIVSHSTRQGVQYSNNTLQKVKYSMQMLYSREADGQAAATRRFARFLSSPQPRPEAQPQIMGIKRTPLFKNILGWG